MELTSNPNNNMSPGKRDILNLSPEELKEEMTVMGEKPFHAGQITRWLYKGTTSFQEMSDLSGSLQSKLDSRFVIGTLQQLKRLVSSDHQAIKYLYLLLDDNIIECVVLKYHHGVTLCLSTQVGCAMGCRFCASTRGGLVRNLTAGEMVAQVLSVQRDHGLGDIGISHYPPVGWFHKCVAWQRKVSVSILRFPFMHPTTSCAGKS